MVFLAEQERQGVRVLAAEGALCVCASLCDYVYLFLYISVYIRLCVSVCLRISVSVGLCLCAYLCISVYISLCLCICVLRPYNIKHAAQPLHKGPWVSNTPALLPQDR